MAGNLQKIYLFCPRGERVYFLIKPVSPYWGLPWKERTCSPREQILSFKSNPQIGSDTVTTIKIKNKSDFFICQRVWKTVKIQEKVREFIGECPCIWLDIWGYYREAKHSFYSQINAVFYFQAMPSWEDWLELVYWMKVRWNWISSWVWEWRTSWKDVSKPKYLS